MLLPEPTTLEHDPRFPSGAWLGFFLDARKPGRHMMDLRLLFQRRKVLGEGRDRVGKFRILGRYERKTGKCQWIKRYLGQHCVHYVGYNEGKGIWGTWEIVGPGFKGGFYIWPTPPAPRYPDAVLRAEVPVCLEPILVTV
jgi:hypothetical protein